MTHGQEDKQLLEDASTLLMFASAAARERSPGPIPASGFPSNPNFQHSAVQNGNNQRRLSATRQSSIDGSPSASVLDQHNATSRSNVLKSPIDSPSTFANLAVSALPPPHKSTTSALPHSLPPFGQHTMSFASPLHAHTVYSFPVPLGQAPVSHSGMIALPQASTNIKPNANPESEVLRPHDGSAQGAPRSNNRVSELVNNPAIQQPESHPIRQTKSASPKGTPSQSQNSVDIFSQQHSHEGLAKKHESSSRYQNIAARTVPTVHKRSVSEGTSLQKSPSASRSPGPASVALSRGISVESGKRRSDNAMIAAAALAAAADIPLLPRKKEEKKTPGSKQTVSSLEQEVVAKDASTVDHHMSAAVVPTPALVSLPMTEEQSKEKALIAPDYSADENKTEEESSSSVAVAASFPDSATAESNGSVSVPVALSIKDENHRSVTTDTDSNVTDMKSITGYKAPPLDYYKVDPDAGTIGCICGIEEDDGFTIQCDICFRWQHCSCMGYVSSEEVPEDEYKCYYCDESKWNKFDPNQCRAATIARLEMEKNDEPPKMPPAPKRKSSNPGIEDKKKRKTEKDARNTAERPPTEKKKSTTTVSPITLPAPKYEVNNKNNPLLLDGSTAEDYQGTYYKLEENDYKTPEVKQFVINLAQNSSIRSIDSTLIESMTSSQYKQMKFSKIILPNHQKYLQERNEFRKSKGTNNRTSIKVKVYSDNPKQKFVSIPKVGLFISDISNQAASGSVIPSGTNIIECLGELDLWTSYVENLTNQYRLWGTVKPKVSKVKFPSVDGTITELVIDSRFVGNESRFIRKSCPTTANCEIRAVCIPQVEKVKFIVTTTKPIVLTGDKLDEELRLPWEWDPSHPISQMLTRNADGTFSEGKKFEDFNDEDKARLVTGVDTILNFVECACNTSTLNNQCSIFKIKKATSYLLRSTRKAITLGNTQISKSKEELIIPKKVKNYVSWKQRLVKRDIVLQSSLLRNEDSASNENEDKLEEKLDSTEVLGNNNLSLELQHSTCVKEPESFSRRRRILEHSKRFSSRNYQVRSGISEEIQVQNIKEDNNQRVLAVPLTSEAMARIKDRINETFKPLTAISSNVDILPEAKEGIAAHLNTQIKPLLPTVVLDEPVSKEKPHVVKKLSFADYKKKMK